MTLSTNLDRMIAWEEGELSEEDTIKLFQDLVNSGMAWRLQGVYGRQANELLELGLIHPPKKKTKENQTDYYGNTNPAEIAHHRGLHKGWIKDSTRHALASKGIKTGRKTRRRK